MEIFKLFGSILIDSADAEKSIQKTNDKAKGVASTLGNGIKTAGKWAAGIATAAAGAATAAGAAAVKVGKEYEVSLKKVSTIADPAVKSLDDISAAVLDLSYKTGESAASLNEAVYQAISGSVNTADAVGFVEQATKLAAGGFTDTSTAVDILTTALNAYGEQSGLTAESVSDMLLMTQNLGKTDVGQLAASMGKIIPTAASVGVQMDELSGMYAVVTANGISTAEATTYMNSMMNELSKSGQKAASNFELAAKEINGSETTFRDFIKNGGSITDALDVMSQYAEKTGIALGDCFGSAEAGKAALVLSSNAEKVKNAVKEMGSSAGATETAYAAMTDTLEHKTELIKKQFQNIGIESYNSMSGTISDVADTVITSLKDNLPAAQDFISKLLKSVSQVVQKSLPHALDFLGKFFDTALKLADGLLEPLMAVFDLLGPVAGLVASILQPVGKLLGSVLRPVAKLIEKLVPIISKILESVLLPLVDILDELLPILDVVFELLEPILDVVLLLIQPIGLILKAVAPLIKLVVTLVSKALEPLKDKLGGVKDAFELLSPVINLIAESFSIIIPAAMGALTDFMNGDWLKGIQTAGDGLMNVFDGVFAFIDGIFGTKLGEWYDEVTGFFQGFGSYLYQMTHGDEINENELHAKYSGIAQDVRLSTNEYIRQGMSAEAALEKAKMDHLKTTEALYYWDNYGNYDANAAYNTIHANGDVYGMTRNSAEYYAQQGRARLPKLAGGGLVYGDTLALVGDNANAKANPEVVAPLSDLSAIIAGAFDGMAAKFADAMQNRPISMNITVSLPDGTELARAMVDDINSLSRQAGRCVINGVS